MTDESKSRQEILKANEVLKKGGIILYPTDTVWGLGCDATRSKSVERIFKLKKRPENKGFIVLLDQFEKLYDYVDQVPDIAADLINSFDRPLTVIYPGAKNLAKNLLHPDGSVAIRIVRNEFCKSLISLFGKPVVSTSANISGEPAPLIYAKIDDKIVNGVDYAINMFRDRIDQVKPSTIIQFDRNGEYTIVRA
jgi:L-threonylcarbamoyladenylate synthase